MSIATFLNKVIGRPISRDNDKCLGCLNLYTIGINSPCYSCRGNDHFILFPSQSRIMLEEVFQLKTVVFDFDGVIHSYRSGWSGELVIPDEPVDGITEEIARIRKAGYRVVVVSTRCATPRGMQAVKDYLNFYGIVVDDVMKEKPPAIVYVDDRAICFDGNPEGLLEKIEEFKPWNR